MTLGATPRLQTLGRLTLLRADGTEDRELATRKRKLVLLALLALSRRPWPRDALVDLFWGEQTEERARHSLSDALSHLRRALGPDAITLRRSEVELGDGFALELDAVAVQAAARDQRWVQVVELYGGPFLSGVHAGGSPRLEQWIDTERLRLDGIFATAAKAECDRLQRAEEYDRCASLAARWLEIAPTSPHAALFRIRGIAADRSPESDQRALDEFARIERRLTTEYGARPDRTVLAVAEEIALRLQERQAPAPGTVLGGGATQESPTPGTAPPVPATQATVSAVTPVPVTTTPAAPPVAVPVSPPVAAPVAIPVTTSFSATREPASAPAVRKVIWPTPSIITLAVAAITALILMRPGRAADAERTARNAASIALTDSPRALALYQEATVAFERDGNSQRAVLLLDSAIALDSTFAMAYRRLGGILSNGVDSRRRTIALLTMATRHAERLPPQERLLTLGSFHTLVSGDYGKAASAYRALLDLSPNDARAWSSLGVVYDYLGDRRRAVEAYGRSLRLNPKRATTWMNVIDGRYALGDSAGAWRALDSLALVFPGHPGLFMRTAALAHAEGDRERVVAELRSLIASSPDNAYHRSTGEMLLAKALWSWGRVDEGDAARRRSVVLDRQRNARESALVGELDLAMASAWLRGDTVQALSRVRTALRDTPMESLPAQDRPHLALTIALASGGDRRGARLALDAHLRDSDSLSRRDKMSLEHQARGMLALSERRPRDAVEEFKQVADALCTVCGLPELGLAYGQLGWRDSAQLVYERYLALHSERRLDMTDAFHGVRIRAAVVLKPVVRTASSDAQRP